MQATTDHEIKPVRGEPEATAAEPCDEYCDPGCVNHTASVGWDLSFGSRINFHPADTSDPRLVVSLHLSDDAIATGMVYREVTSQQVAAFGQNLLALAGAPSRDDIMGLIHRYVLARIAANVSVPSKAQRESATCVAWHERDEAEVRRLEAEISAALAQAGLRHG